MSISIGGVYKHYKGNLYSVLALGKYEADESDVVIYEALYDNPVSKVWVRRVDNFTEFVEINGKQVPRFALFREGE